MSVVKTVPFTWDSDGTNYIAFQSDTSARTMDNLSIQSLPEPGCIALLSAAGVALLARRHRKFLNPAH
jgi:hypothetical protein